MMTNRRSLVTALCVAAGLGTLTSAAIVVLAYLLVIFIFPVLIVPYIAWMRWARAMQSRGRLRSLPAVLAVLLTAVAVPVCAVLPYQMARFEMRVRSADTPLPHSMDLTKVVAVPFGNSTTGPGVVYYLEPRNGAVEALRTFSARLEREGWKLVLGGEPGAGGYDLALLFKGPSNATLFVNAEWNKALHAYPLVKLRRAVSPLSPTALLLVLSLIFVMPFIFRGKEGVKSP